MKKDQSGWISLVLYALVVLSLYLTWRILIVPSNTVTMQPVNPGSPTTPVAPSNVKSLEDIFKPHQMAVHTESDTYVTQSPEIMTDASEFLTKWKMKDVAFQMVYPETSYKDLLLGTGRVEIIFPSFIYLGSLSHYFDSLPEELYEHHISRILISINPEDPIYLTSDETRNVYTARRPEASMNPLISLYSQNQSEFQLSDAYLFEHGVTLLPRHSVSAKSMVYLVEKQPNSFFINYLFDDTTELRDDSTDVVTAYSDNMSELRINRDTGVLYYHRNSLDPVTLTPYEQVRDGFHFLKFIDTWTQSSYFSGFDEDTSEATFYRFVEGLPIFNSMDRGVIKIEMGNTHPLKIQYPTEVIQTPLTDREEIIDLPPTDEVISRLMNRGFDFNDFQDMQIGYDWKSSEESTRMAVLTPQWFVKIRGSWRSVESWLVLMEETEHGL